MQCLFIPFQDTGHGEHKIKARWIPRKVKVEEHVVVPNIDQNIENIDQFREYYTTNKAIELSVLIRL